MSAPVLFALTLLYLFPLALLGLLLSRWKPIPRWMVALLLASLPLFYVGHYEALKSIQGWPSNAPLPQEFQLLGSEIREPDPATEDRGEILLWVRAAEDGRARLHRLAYSRGLHQSLEDAGRELAAGHPQIGRSSRPGPAGVAGLPAAQQGTISFSREEPAPLPEKTSEP